MPGFRGLFPVQVVFAEEAAGRFLVRMDHDFADFAVGNGIAVRVHDIHIVLGAGFTHGADFRHGAVQVADGQRGFRLAEAFHDGQARSLFELAEDFRIQGFAGGGHMVDGGQVIVLQVHLDEHPQHGRRGAEGGDVVLPEHRQDVRRVKLVKVVYENRALTQPLPVQLAPQGLAPARVGNRQVQAVPLAAVPVFGGHIVAQRVGVLVGRHFGVAGGAGGEEHEGNVIAAGSVRRAVIAAGKERVFRIEVMPAFPDAVDHDQGFDAGAFGRGALGDLRCIPVGRADQRADAGGVEAVFKVVLLQLVGGGNGDGPQLVQRDHGEPELVMAFQHEHDPVPAPDAQGSEIIGALVGGVLDILEGETALLVIAVHIEHGQLVRIFPRDFIHDIEAEIEGFRVREVNRGQPALVILHRVDEFGCHQRLLGPVLGQVRPDIGGRFFLSAGLVAGKHDGAEHAVMAVHRDHAVGKGRVVVDAVALVQDFGVVADLHLQAALQHDVEFLALMGGQVDRLRLLGFGVFIPDPVGLRDFILELGRQVGDGDAFLPGGGFALAAAGDRIGGQEGVMAFQQLGQLHVEGLGGFIDKGERHIRPAGFILFVLFEGHVRFFGHFLCGPAHDFPHFPDTGGNGFQLAEIGLRIHWFAPFFHKKTARLALRRVVMTRGTTQIVCPAHPFRL